MIYAYKILTGLIFIAALPILPLLYLFSKKRRASLIPRLGFPTGLAPLKKNGKRVWIHALSVGEVKSVLPLVKDLKKKKPDLEMVITASTQTGFKLADTLFLKPKLVNQIAFFPYDLGFCVRRICDRIDPDAVVIVETDLWPTFLFEMQKKSVPTVLINARLSLKSLNGYARFKLFFGLFFSYFTRIMAQTDQDRKRFEKLGIESSKILTTGNMKFDQVSESMDPEQIQSLRVRLGIRPSDKVLLAGSTHEGEEILLLDWFEKAMRDQNDIKLVIAPRNPDRSGGLKQLSETRQIPSRLMSEINNPDPDSWVDGLADKGPKVVFIDAMGILSRLYSICDLAFVGGTLVNEGGHNPLEPAAYAKPVLFGPDTSDFTEIADQLISGGGTVRVSSVGELEPQLNRLFFDTDRLKKMGMANQSVFVKHSGAVNTIISQLEQLSIV